MLIILSYSIFEPDTRDGHSVHCTVINLHQEAVFCLLQSLHPPTLSADRVRAWSLDVIVPRWQQLTGKHAVISSSGRAMAFIKLLADYPRKGESYHDLMRPGHLGKAKVHRNTERCHTRRSERLSLLTI